MLVMILMMFVLIVPCVAMVLLFLFGLLAVLLEVFGKNQPQTAKFIVVTCGCILIAWFLYTWKSGESTEANRDLINRLERDYRVIQHSLFSTRQLINNDQRMDRLEALVAYYGKNADEKARRDKTGSPQRVDTQENPLR